MNAGIDTPGGFLPGAPELEDIFKRVGVGKGWAGINASDAGKGLEEGRESAAIELKRKYARFAASPDGREILEDILNQTLRRSPYHPSTLGATPTLEQQVAYGLERQGQNGLAIHILKMVHDGQNLPAPGVARVRKRKG